jgi:hypothetical protein
LTTYKIEEENALFYKLEDESKKSTLASSLDLPGYVPSIENPQAHIHRRTTT